MEFSTQPLIFSPFDCSSLRQETHLAHFYIPSDSIRPGTSWESAVLCGSQLDVCCYGPKFLSPQHPHVEDLIAIVMVCEVRPLRGNST